MVQGRCSGGPLEGQEYISRFPKGFILVDKPADRVWIYDWNEAAEEFWCRVAEGFILNNDPTGAKNRWRAAEESNYDVLAAPWIGADGGGSSFGEHVVAEGGTGG